MYIFAMICILATIEDNNVQVQSKNWERLELQKNQNNEKLGMYI